MIRHTIVMSTVLSVILLTAGCSSPQEPPQTFSDLKIATTFDPQMPFPRSARYAFMRLSPDQEKLSPEAVAIVDRVREALTKELKSKKYRVDEKNGHIDFVIDYELVAQHNVSILAERTRMAGEDWITVVGIPDDFIEGALVVDVIDIKSLRTVWRGICNVNVALLPVSEAEKQQRVEYAVKKLLETFPPKQ